MVFSSPIFIFFFLPFVLLGYYLTFFPVKYAQSARLRRIFLVLCNTIILCSSLVFYFWGEKWLVLVMLTSTVIDYFCGLGMGRVTRSGYRKLLLALSISANLSLLFFFKYFNFGLDNYNAFVESFGFNGMNIESTLRIALPLGISFYTFQSMSYTIDVFRREVEPTRNFLDFSCYVTMFPQLVAGPIVRYRDIKAQLVERTINRDLFSTGVMRFILGLGKKVLIANTVAVPADQIFSMPTEHLTPELAWLGISCYTLQIYFDFSGYSDMAIGLGRMLGFNYLENFNYPYFARSIQDFWRRWHMSLSSWFRDYLYIPLGGGRGKPWRVYFNLVLVFLLCGLWHGASWAFVIWGLYHGAFLVVERLGLSHWLEKRNVVLRHVYVILVAMGGWVLFRAETFPQAMAFYAALFGHSPGDGVLYNAARFLNRELILAMILGGILSWPVVPMARGWWADKRPQISGVTGSALHFTYSSAKVLIVLLIALLAIMNISSGAYNPFIYFRF